jgi:hypothetical protein
LAAIVSGYFLPLYSTGCSVRTLNLDSFSFMPAILPERPKVCKNYFHFFCISLLDYFRRS